MNPKSSGEFEDMVTKAIKAARIKKQAIAAELEIHHTGFARLMRGEMKKPKIVALVHVVNKLAGREVLNLNQTLKVAGFEETENRTINQMIGSYVAELPPNVQEDVLLIVEALYKKYVK